MRLILTLNITHKVEHIATAYPHVLNRLAELWEDPQQVEVYLEQLTLSDRSSRTGFSFRALAELASLRTLNQSRKALTSRPMPAESVYWRG